MNTTIATQLHVRYLKEEIDLAHIRAELVKLKVLKKSTIHPDGAVDINGSITLPRAYTSIPVKFGHVTGDFACVNTAITSLVGAPNTVGGDFWCSGTNITSLEGAPQMIGGSFFV